VENKKVKERDYILGTHQAELERLGLQHRVWRPYVLEAWQKAGISVGAKVLDVGSGPGYAAFDLADIVGKSGKVVCVERSEIFTNYLKEKIKEFNNHIEVYQIDLMEDEIPTKNFDFAWCRWVACFVNSPQLLVRKISECLSSGGKVIFHEYINYDSWQMLPPDKYQKEFVDEVLKSWRADGGEPDVAAYLPDLLYQHKLEIVTTKPLVFCCSPKDYFWQWPESFIEINVKRQVELGNVSNAWADEVVQSFQKSKENEHTKYLLI